MKPWLNVSEAAEYAGVSRDTIYTACERHELRSARVSGRRAVVRFNVKPEERESFEGFFWESLRPAAAKRADVQVEDVDLGGVPPADPVQAESAGLLHLLRARRSRGRGARRR
jgi:excisionase family DNA binding protein